MLTIFSGLYIGWAIGANDAANSMGTAVGARVRTLAQAVILVSVFGVLGALLQGSYVIKTVGKGIVPLDTLPKLVSAKIALAAGLAAGTWVMGCTYLKLPVSTSHAIVGAVAGAGLAVGRIPVYWGKLRDVFISWVLTPIGGAVLGYVLYRLLVTASGRRLLEDHLYRLAVSLWTPLNKVVSRLSRGRFGLKRPANVYGLLLTVSGCYMAFTWGANDVANATGAMAGAGLVGPRIGALIGGLAIALGVMTWGYKVIETIGSRITHLLPVMAFAAELASGINVQVYTLLGFPVSTSHSIVGAVFGVGLVHGKAAIDKAVARDIVLAWAATPVLAGVLAFGFCRLMMMLF